MVTYTDLLNARFQYNARGENNRYDCYGLCMEVSRRMGRELPEILTPRGFLNMQELLVEETENGVRWRPIPPSEGEWGVIQGQPRVGPPLDYGIKEGAIAYFRVKGLLAHVGIVVAPDTFIHAWEQTGGVCVERLTLWKSRLVGLYEHKADPC
ncbi:NlpC/P60 family protein [Halomonas sp. S2151]|uniref:NlpC/P60 family protein n=1 Tax=Halomonas sp. S2151 TaxID=579478 RepID=UPI000B333B7C|nr:NlpC/P60 family protein [Halomonas sp. S2151]